MKGQIENGWYEYEVLFATHKLKEKAWIIRRSRIADGNARGTIEPGNYVGGERSARNL